MVLQVEWGQRGAGEPGRRSTAPAGLAEVLPDPVKQQGVGAAGSGGSVEVNDAAAAKHTSGSLTGLGRGPRSLPRLARCYAPSLLPVWLAGSRQTEAKTRVPGPHQLYEGLAALCQNTGHLSQPGSRAERRVPPDSQRGEQAEDLRGADPGPRPQQPLVEVGRPLRIQALPPGPFNHPLQLRDAGHRPLWRTTSRLFEDLTNHQSSSTSGPRVGTVTLEDGGKRLQSVQSGEKHLKVPVATAPPSVPRRGAEVVRVRTQPHVDAVGVLSLVVLRQRPHHTWTQETAGT